MKIIINKLIKAKDDWDKGECDNDMNILESFLRIHFITRHVRLAKTKPENKAENSVVDVEYIGSNHLRREGEEQSDAAQESVNYNPLRNTD